SRATRARARRGARTLARAARGRRIARIARSEASCCHHRAYDERNRVAPNDVERHLYQAASRAKGHGDTSPADLPTKGHVLLVGPRKSSVFGNASCKRCPRKVPRIALLLAVFKPSVALGWLPVPRVAANGASHPAKQRVERGAPQPSPAPDTDLSRPAVAQ